jgi:hypothetical protein
VENCGWNNTRKARAKDLMLFSGNCLHIFHDLGAAGDAAVPADALLLQQQSRGFLEAQAE